MWPSPRLKIRDGKKFVETACRLWVLVRGEPIYANSMDTQALGQLEVRTFSSTTNVAGLVAAERRLGIKTDTFVLLKRPFGICN